ncbi:MAG TPA: SPOR domain-containing protein [Pyrinomonadaceae bacterium]|nr:SPOR domain-containing protein [Pyrinomonadaceae bacterium]
MTYDFSLDKKAMISLIAASLVLAVLLFAAGWVGGNYWTNGSPTSAAAASKTAPATDREALPKEPVLIEEPLDSAIAVPETASETAKPDPVAPKAIPGSIPGVSTSQVGSPESVIALAQQPETTMDQSVNRQEQAHPAGVRGNIDQDVAEASEFLTAGNNATGKSGFFTVQVGVFLEQQEASRLLQAMERKGYSPSFFADRDSENRQWYAIRIGAYSDKNQAAAAAANFTKQELIKATVRPLGSL